VGTRKASAYWLSVCKDLIKELSVFSPIIVSGLAYGIDSCAHKEALKNNLQTIGVLAHGLERIYPQSNESLAKQMTRNGGLLTEFLNSSKLIWENDLISNTDIKINLSTKNYARGIYFLKFQSFQFHRIEKVILN